MTWGGVHRQRGQALHPDWQKEFQAANIACSQTIYGLASAVINRSEMTAGSPRWCASTFKLKDSSLSSSEGMRNFISMYLKALLIGRKVVRLRSAGTRHPFRLRRGKLFDHALQVNKFQREITTVWLEIWDSDLWFGLRSSPTVTDLTVTRWYFRRSQDQRPVAAPQTSLHNIWYLEKIVIGLGSILKKNPPCCRLDHKDISLQTLSTSPNT